MTTRLHLRMLNHWHNLDGLDERGHAGASLWNWLLFFDADGTAYLLNNGSPEGTPFGSMLGPFAQWEPDRTEES